MLKFSFDRSCHCLHSYISWEIISLLDQLIYQIAESKSKQSHRQQRSDRLIRLVIYIQALASALAHILSSQYLINRLRVENSRVKSYRLPLESSSSNGLRIGTLVVPTSEHSTSLEFITAGFLSKDVYGSANKSSESQL